ncbi:hypothetical protein [Sodalis sp.]|uniref:hypothetical protein n=1 Tax=Sodalis sp. (in: enterobacteria) TaxID=1898979 RepID=UPI0038733B96
MLGCEAAFYAAIMGYWAIARQHYRASRRSGVDFTAQFEIINIGAAKVMQVELPVVTAVVGLPYLVMDSMSLHWFAFIARYYYLARD